MRVLVLLFVLFIQFSFAQTIAYTSFEEVETSSIKYTDTGDKATDHALVNNAGEPQVNYVSVGGEMGFTSFYYNTQDDVGLTDGDYVGVTDYTGVVGAFLDGTKGFQLSDADGYMVTTFDTIDVSAYPSVKVSVPYFLKDDTWETDPEDFLRVWVVLDGETELDLLNTQGQDINDLGIVGAWNTLEEVLIGYSTVTIKVGLQCNSSNEAVYFDNIYIVESASSNPTPKISETGVSALVPLADQDFIDTVKAFDESAISSVSLFYSVNEASAQEVVMTDLGADSLYIGTIPASAYNDGDRVVYWSTATDDSSATSSTDEQGFFAGNTAISALKQLAADQELAYEGYYARSTGVATVSSGVFSTNSLSVYMQDEAYGAIAVHKTGASSATVVAGNSYTIVGKVYQFNGLAQLEPMDIETDIIDNGEATMPEAFEVNIENLLNGAETWEGLLVKVMSADTVSAGYWPESGADANILITDDAGSNQLTLRVDKDTDVDDQLEPSWPQNITGIFSQYDFSAPYDEYYQLIPRAFNDFEDATAIGDAGTHVPDQLQLLPAYPNPFNPGTKISFNMPASMLNKGTFELAVYNSLGQKVRVLATRATSGRNEISWDGLNEFGQLVSTGIYYAVLNASNQHQSIKLLLLK